MRHAAVRCFLAVLSLALPAHAVGAAAGDAAAFRSAKPIWPQGRREEMNLSVGFTAQIETPREGKTLLRIAAASIYRVRVNGEFVACGPARLKDRSMQSGPWRVEFCTSDRFNPRASNCPSGLPVV